MCVTCTLQGLEQGAAAGSASGGVGLLAAGLASVGFRGAATRLVALSPRLVVLASSAVALAVLLTVVALRPF
jgi:preprotein translocase subunit Sec61beta